MKNISMFDKQFRKMFNQNKYLYVSSHAKGDKYSVQFFADPISYLWGQRALNLTLVVLMIYFYVDNRNFQHLFFFTHHDMRYRQDFINNNISGEERRLNELIIKREKHEQKIKDFKEKFTNFKGEIDL